MGRELTSHVFLKSLKGYKPDRSKVNRIADERKSHVSLPQVSSQASALKRSV